MPSRKSKAKQPAIERGEQAGFVPEGFIRQHRAELFEDDVQVEQKKHGRQDEHKNSGAEKGFPRHPIVPVKKRAKPEIDEPEEFRAVQRIAPGAFLLLEIAHLPEAKNQQAGGGERGNEAERFQPVGPGGFHANDQRRGQSPEQRGQTAGKMPE